MILALSHFLYFLQLTQVDWLFISHRLQFICVLPAIYLPHKGFLRE